MAVSNGFRAYAAVVLFLTLVSTATAKYSGGTGEPNDPYQIATAADLIALGETPEDYDKHFILTADIDLDPNLPGRKVFDRAVIAPDTDPASYGHQGTSFTGVFDGDGHTISHLTINGKANLGLFGELAIGEIRDVGLVDITITGSGEVVGGLVGNNTGFVTRCYCGGTVRGTEYVGGLVGNNEGPWGGFWPGGTVSQCYSTSTVCGNWFVGGLVGDNVGQHAAGIALGSRDGNVTQCYSTGAVSGIGCVGGLVGRNTGNWGFAGIVDGCFWDMQTSGQATSEGGTGLPTLQMQDLRTYLHAGWDWAGEIENGTSEIWQIPEGGGYPVLSIFNGYAPLELKGNGTVEDPYLISDAMELGAVVHYSAYAHYRLAASIDLGGICWGTAVIPWFAGTFDGNNLTISNLRIEGHSLLGLLGELTSAGEIKNVGVVDVNITGLGDRIGALVGSNHGSVTQCYSHGTVSGDSEVGGLVGTNGWDYKAGGGSITMSYSTGAVSGKNCVGGLVGYSDRGTVRKCYSTGAVSGDWSVGGLVGSGRAEDTAGCFWDTEASGQVTSPGGTGKTTAEMQTAKTFLDAGWDFVGETANGTEDIWKIAEGLDYPRLWWEATEE